MTDRWYCPHYVQSSTRNWNIKTHIKRRHYGAGIPLRKSGYTLRSTDNPALSGTNHAYLSGQINRSEHESHTRNASAGSQDFVGFWADFLAGCGKLRNQIVAFSGYPFPNLFSSMPDPQMSLRSAFGFRAQPCYACLNLGLVPVFYPDEAHNLPQFTHTCNPINFQPKIFKNLEDYSTLLLKDVAIQTLALLI